MPQFVGVGVPEIGPRENDGIEGPRIDGLVPEGLPFEEAYLYIDAQRGEVVLNDLGDLLMFVGLKIGENRQGKGFSVFLKVA